MATLSICSTVDLGSLLHARGNQPGGVDQRHRRDNQPGGQISRWGRSARRGLSAGGAISPAGPISLVQPISPAGPISPVQPISPAGPIQPGAADQPGVEGPTPGWANQPGRSRSAWDRRGLSAGAAPTPGEPSTWNRRSISARRSSIATLVRLDILNRPGPRQSWGRFDFRQAPQLAPGDRTSMLATPRIIN